MPLTYINNISNEKKPKFKNNANNCTSF
uniref:Uncharacterized protein n=1 Tax=Rhizophora mucronata TaxID=61149 RepID=A0A2P2NXI9_RHIMU